LNLQFNIAQLQTDKQFKQYENLIVSLFNNGYREMPLDMKNLIVNRLQKDSMGFIMTDHTPKGFQSINPSDDRYATLSNGIFDEVHEPKLIEQYNHTLLNTQTRKISKFVASDTLYNKYNFDPVVFAWCIDPLATKYPSISPYSAFGDSPMYIIDPGGETLHVVTNDPKDIDNFKAMIKTSFNGHVEADVDASGNVSFKFAEWRVLSDNERAGFMELHTVTSSDNTATFNLVNNSVDVTTANFYTSQLDIADVQSFGNDPNNQTSMSVFVHESVEQLEKGRLESIDNKKITETNDPDKKTYNNCHKKGIVAENKTSTFERDPDAWSLSDKKTGPAGTVTSLSEPVKIKRINPASLAKSAIKNTTYQNNNDPKSTVTPTK
jgi:hypothetical protein